MRFFNNNEPISAITHSVGFALAIVGLFLMLVFAVVYADTVQVVGAVIFGVSMIILYGVSAFYHFIAKDSKYKKIFKRLDHAMIYILIAGTYTPITLSMPQRGWGWSLFGVIWGIATVGVILKTRGNLLTGWISAVIYLVMGWLAVTAIYPLWQWLGSSALLWLLLGGIAYTVGVLFFALEKLVKKSVWLTMHDIFHLFVMLGSFSHFWLVFKYIIFT